MGWCIDPRDSDAKTLRNAHVDHREADGDASAAAWYSNRQSVGRLIDFVGAERV